MRCPSCSHDNRAERRFCAECGAPLAATCVACGASNEPGEKFCGGCGAQLHGVTGLGVEGLRAPTPTPNPSTPNSISSEVGERRQLTVLFCDLVGSTPLSQQLDPEDWRDVVGQYQNAARVAVERWGGHVAKELGDGLLVYFGWPDARGDDPERARVGRKIACLSDDVYSTAFRWRRMMPVRLNITMDADLYERLKRELPAKRISRFINDAVRARLHPDRRTLDAAYKAARKEAWRKELAEEWEATETEGWPR